jgi:myb proto-oncogene protein
MNFVKTVRNPRKIKESFTEEEDKMIEKYIQEYGMKSLEELEKRLVNRSARQIRERYRLYLDPKVDHSPFTAQEDELLFNAFDQFHGKWCLMVKMFSGRTDVALKHRHRKLIRNSNREIRTSKKRNS